MLAFLKDALKKYSVQGMSVAGVIMGVWMAMPASLQAVAPTWVIQSAVLAFIAYGLIGRFIPQTNTTP